MKKMVRIMLAVTMSAVLLLGLAGCGKGNGGSSAGGSSSTADGTASTADIAGTYVLDGTPLGMPLQAYVIIQADGTFKLTNKLENGDDKGSGKVGKSDATYMFVYSDSTSENPKTATFTVEGKKLVFSTKLPYGSSSFAPNTEDGDNVVYPEAKAIVYDAYLGDYAGTFEKNVEAMGASIVYSYTMTLSYGAEYTFESRYTVMGEEQVYTQKGTFAVDGKEISVKADGESEETKGSIADDKSMTMSMLLSAQGKEKTEITLKKATTAAYSGTYTGQKTLKMGDGITASTTLVLDKFGGYTYTSKIEGEEDYVENGTYSVAEEAITFTSSADGAEPVKGTIANYVVTAKFKISPSVPMATEITSYASQIQGAFTAESNDDAKGYVGSLNLNADGSYTLSVTKDGTETYAQKGTFTTQASSMGSNLVLTSEDNQEMSAVISDASINLTHAVDNKETGAGFQYEKK